MKAQCFSQKPQTIVMGLILILTLGGFEASGRVFQAQQTSSTTLGWFANGTHLYGETSQPNQIGKGYVVFSHQNGRVVGAFYYPRSEFDCFAGSLKNNMLDVRSVGTDDPEIVAVKVNLSDLHSIPALSKGDQQMLSVCQKETAERLSRKTAKLFSSLLRFEKHA